jgi:hypothetical protein
MLDVKRRDFITLCGAAAAWPRGTRAQQQVSRTIGYLSPRSPAFEADCSATRVPPSDADQLVRSLPHDIHEDEVGENSRVLQKR